jgi:hypothetical protein
VAAVSNYRLLTVRAYHANNQKPLCILLGLLFSVLRGVDVSGTHLQL